MIYIFYPKVRRWCFVVMLVDMFWCDFLQKDAFVEWWVGRIGIKWKYKMDVRVFVSLHNDNLLTIIWTINALEKKKIWKKVNGEH